ncbi:aspartyl/asparaginyl beta-hydroxylase domain-containing protein [Streptomyces griseoviridis]|uniref:Aspartyl beta-hydroxylase n=1 Tax=Streptomyces griseoviridis TaxID=45398 RepID=A0A3S9ZLZ0_STRGD|nr:aspartyl/asparaginyl beta-hydroxylase domain-containing protein [Streptomyces griseoviridis]AZS88827.1 aspartyl beta-hydroxylase [Streptomyces griseoviridis]QCN84334.1 aspartyl beta-hydroxylase [Streptomyces griseoviridis]
MADTQLAGRVDIDPAAVAEDLARAAGFRFSEAYSDYLCGGLWKSLMLFASGGEGGDGLITNYDHARKSSVTAFGEQLPYLRQVVERNFHLENLNFARIAEMTNSVTVPHRDLLELEDIPQEARNAHRMHIPLETNEGALFTEDNVVYRMAVGDVWFFDASKVHGAAALTTRSRTHLILDFTDAADAADVVRFPLELSGGIPEDRISKRPSLTDAELEALYRLADVVDLENYRDVLGLVIKKHYRRDGGEDFVWRTLTEIGRRCPDQAVRTKIQEELRFFLMERSAQTTDGGTS